MSTLIILFVTKTQVASLENARSASAQMAESKELREYAAVASARTYPEILKVSKESHNNDLRAKLARNEADAEFVFK